MKTLRKYPCRQKSKFIEENNFQTSFSKTDISKKNSFLKNKRILSPPGKEINIIIDKEILNRKEEVADKKTSVNPVPSSTNSRFEVNFTYL